MDESTGPLPPMLFDERLIVRNQQTGEPIPNLRYIAHLDDGSRFDGVTDEHGRTALIVSDKEQRVRFEFFPVEE